MWPPFPSCPRCLSETSLETIDAVGTVLEFTNSYVKGMEGTFGLIDMSGVKLIGAFDTCLELREGLKVKMTRCGIRKDGTAFYFFEPF